MRAHGCVDSAVLPYSSESWPGRRCGDLGARELLELRRGLGRERGAVLDHRRGGVGRELARAQLLGGALQARDQIVQLLDAAHGICAFSRTSRNTAPSTPLTNPGASAPQNVFALSTASSIAPSGGIGCLGGDRVGVQHLDQRHAHDAALERLDPLHRPAVRVAVDHLVELLRAVGRGVRQRAREQRVAAARASPPAAGR